MSAPPLEVTPRAERAYQAARLCQFFDFAAHDPRLAWPEIDLDVEGGSEPRIRTALIGPHHIATALQAFAHDPVAQSAVLLAARGGLRLSDTEALRLGDVEAGKSGNILIHPTLWGSLKSSSARRMVPLAALLTSAELRLWNGFVERRRMEAGSDDAPLLAQGGGLLPYIRLDRRQFAADLAKLGGLRPHDLRHGAISNLALILLAPSAETGVLNQVTGWSVRQCTELRERFIAKDPWRGMKELASLAGHRDPATTLESYIHICDLALGLHIRAASSALPRESAARILGLNRRSFSSRKRHVAPESLRAKVLERLSVTAFTQTPVLTVPPPATSEMTVQMILQIEAAIQRQVPATTIAAKFHLPTRVVNALIASDRVEKLKTLKDRLAVVEMAMRLLTQPEARAWALQTLAAPARGISFFAPLAAELWLSPLSGQLRYRAELKATDLGRWGLWAKASKIIPRSTSGPERLYLVLFRQRESGA